VIKKTPTNKTVSAPKPVKTGKRIRDSSVVLLSTTVLNVVTMGVFSRFGVPLSSKEEVGVVAGVWFVVLAGSVWLWKHFRNH